MGSHITGEASAIFGQDVYLRLFLFDAVSIVSFLHFAGFFRQPSPIGQAGIEPAPQIMRHNRNLKFRMLVPAKRLGAHFHFRRACFGWLAKWGPPPGVAMRQNLRHEPDARHRCMRGERDEGCSTFTGRAGQTDHLRSVRLGPRQNNQRKSAASQQLLGSAKCILPVRRPHQNWSFLPELPGNGPKSIDPGRAFPSRCDRKTRSPEDRCRSSLREPNREPPARQSTTRQNGIEWLDSSRDRLRCPMRERGCIGKSLLQKRAEGRSRGHGYP